LERDDIRVRTASGADTAAIEAILEASPDGGAVRFNRERHVTLPAGHRGLHDRVIHVVAEADGAPGPVGVARLALGECRFGGAWTRYALLSSLAVHPRHRRRGVAAALASHRIALARELAGDDVLVLANVQSGNQGSLAAARRWATSSGGRMVAIPVPMRARPPRGRPDLVLRPAGDGDLEQVAEALTARPYDFGLRFDAERLGGWLAASPLPDPVNHYLVVTDRAGRLLAGLGLREEGRLQSLVVQHAPLAIRLANRLVRVIPPDGRLRNVVADKVWFAPGRLAEARHLWQSVRWEWRGRGSTLLTTHDPRGPVHAMVHAPRWFPATTATVQVRTTRPVREGAIIDPLL